MRFNHLLKYRQAWLGIALLWVMFFHCPFEFGPLNYLRRIGYGGVDICLFASGIGCFYSLSSEPNIIHFMKRRVKRLVPTYIIFIIAWLFWQYTIGDFNLQMALGNLLALQNLTGHGNAFNWYISAIFVLYILAPYFKIVAQQASTTRKIAFLLFLIISSIPFWNAGTYLITITRFPVFYIGMLFADLCNKNKQIEKIHVICMITTFLLGIGFLLFSFAFAYDYMWGYGLYWYPFILIAPPLCMIISFVCMVLEKAKLTKPMVTFLHLCGNYSFELYLIHIPLFDIIPMIIEKCNLSNCVYWVWGAMCIVCLPVGCFMLRYLATLLSRFCSTMQHKQSKHLS